MYGHVYTKLLNSLQFSAETLVVLDLSNTHVEQSNVAPLANLLEKTKLLQELSLCKCGLTPDAASILANGLRGLFYLNMLKISENDILRHVTPAEIPLTIQHEREPYQKLLSGNYVLSQHLQFQAYLLCDLSSRCIWDLQC